MRNFATTRLRRFETVVALSLVLFVALIAGLSLLGDGAAATLQAIGRIPPALVFGLLGLSLVNYASRGIRWQLYCRRLDVRLPIARSMLYFIAGFALGTTPGKVGEALRLWLLERGHGYRYERVTPLLLGDRISDANGVLLLCLIGFSGVQTGSWPTAVATIGVVALTLAFMFPATLLRLVSAIYALGRRRGRRLFARLRTGLRHTARLFAPRLFAATLLLSLAGWFAEALAFHWLLVELGATIALLPATFVFALAVLAGAVSMLPGGLGSTEAVMLGLLIALEVDFGTALAATAVIRATTLWFGVGLGFIALPFAMRLARRGPSEGGRLRAAVR